MEENLRKANNAVAAMITTINTDTSDRELDSFMNRRVGDLIDAMNKMPKQMKDLSFGEFLDIIIACGDDDAMEELCSKLGLNEEEMTEEEALQFSKDLEAFCLGMGLGLEDEES